MSEQDWRWIPVSESPGEEPRKICVLKDGEKDVYWWTDTLGFEEDITHWCEVRYPPLPESEKPPIQEVCEWLGVVTTWVEPLETPVWHDALLWRIEEELVKRLARLRPVYMAYEDGVEWIYQVKRESAIYGVSHDGASRGEALIKAAMWLMEQEGSDE